MDSRWLCGCQYIPQLQGSSSASLYLTLYTIFAYYSFPAYFIHGISETNPAILLAVGEVAPGLSRDDFSIDGVVLNPPNRLAAAFSVALLERFRIACKIFSRSVKSF